MFAFRAMRGTRKTAGRAKHGQGTIREDDLILASLSSDERCDGSLKLSGHAGLAAA